MTHPDELLPGYVDGSLSADERAAVDAHVASCARCRTEIGLAGTGRAAARALPEPEPPDLEALVMDEIRDQASHPRAAGSPRWFRIGGIAAAAVIAVAIAVSLPRVGTAPSGDREAADAGLATPTVGGATQLAALTLEVERTDYNAAAVQALARAAAHPAAEASAPSTAERASPEETARAQTCMARAFPDFPGTPTRLISARFQGAPAYLAVVLEGPAPGQPADTASVWVAARDTCAPLSFTTIRI